MKKSRRENIKRMEDTKLIRAVIVGANEALKYKEKNFNATEQEVLEFVTLNAKKLIRNID